MTTHSYRTLGSTGLRVSPLALGAMNFDDGTWGSAPETSSDILDRYLDAGGNFIDTANQYNGGKSERTLGDYFGQRPGVRDRVVLATKFGGTLHPADPNAGGAGRKAIYTQIDESLRRLKTDYVDLYWMHQWDRHTPIEETLSTLDDLVRAGKIRAIGVSNVPAWWVGQAVRQQTEVTSTLIGARTVEQLQANMASIEVVLSSENLARLSALTEPTLDYPMNVIRGFATGFLQGDTTINGLNSTAFRRE
jgi:aryl-alcohol dehydrogenase-like predicted oxidoreductase